MADRFSVSTRSDIMSKVKAQDTKPELWVRSAVHRGGFRFRKNDPKLPGKPDLVLRRYRTAVFIHGCFWHQHKGCKRAKLPLSNLSFWERKLASNEERDENISIELKRRGWGVVTIWECNLRQGTSDLLQQLSQMRAHHEG